MNLVTRIAVFTCVSVLVVIPCFWHRHIEAGDLGSHVYNAWLTTLVQNHQARCLYLVESWTNFLFDNLLIWFCKAFGFFRGTKLTLAVLVLIFFWGSLSFVRAAADRGSWFIAPALAMLAYGFTFNSGFCNCYLSIGLALFALAVVWRKDSWLRWLAAAALLALSVAAHPFGIAVFLGLAAYQKLAQIARRNPRARWLLFALGLAVVYATRVALSQYSPVYGPARKFLLFNGGDQLYLFGVRYGILGELVTLFGAIIFLPSLFNRPRQHSPEEPGFRVPLELFAILMSCALLLPQVIRLPQYATIFGPIVSRLTLVTAIVGFAVVASVRPRIWHFAGYVSLAIIFFLFLFEDTGTLSGVADQADSLIRNLPYGTRVVETMGGKRGWRTNFLHVIEPECIGHCFVYDNYEPASKQFRIRAQPGCRLATSSMRESVLLQYGEYSVIPAELPLKQIYQCTAGDITHLCIKDIVAGQPNCAGCNYAFYYGGKPPES